MLKKLFSLILITALVFSPVQVHADESASPAVQAPQTMPYGYVPLRNAAEISGFNCRFENGITYLDYNGNILEFIPGETTGYINKAEISYTAPPILINDTLCVSYDDISFLFANGKSPYAVTKKTAITSAYYYMDLYKIPSVSIALTDADTNYGWTIALGYKNLEKNELPNENTVYGMGSISKVFTAIAIMQLVEKGKLDLDEKVLHYIPEIKTKPHPVYGGSFKDVTIRMLLAHVSGIPGDWIDNFYTNYATDKNYMNTFVEYLSGEYLDSVPGFRWSYANNGYTLLGVIISRAAGFTNDYDGFMKYMSDNVINKMGLKSTSFSLTNATRQNLAGSYANSLQPEERFIHLNAVPAGGLMSCGADMERFMQYLLGYGTYEQTTILSSRSVAEMANPSGFDMSLNPNIEMGLGLYTTQYGNLVMTGHGGTTQHFHSDMQLSFRSKLGVFATANSSSAIVAPGYLSVLILNAAVQEKTGVPNNITKRTIPLSSEISPEKLNEITGYYTGIGKVEAAKDSMIYVPALNMYFEHKADGSFYNENIGSLRFQRINGLDTLMLDSGISTSFLGEKILPVPQHELSEYAGIYKPITPGEFEIPIFSAIEIKVNDEGIASLSFYSIDGQMSGSVVLAHVRGGMYYIMGTSRDHGKVVNFKHFAGMRYLDVFGDSFMKAD